MGEHVFVGLHRDNQIARGRLYFAEAASTGAAFFALIHHDLFF
jgi:hypothetical protein